MAIKKKHAKKAPVAAQPVTKDVHAVNLTATQAQENLGLEERLAKLKVLLDKIDDKTPFTVPIGDLGSYGVKTVTIVARNVAVLKDGKEGRFQMETGRMAAQAGHAVSKLKLGYLLWNNQSETGRSYDFAHKLYKTSITNIILEARDEKELSHILNLCRDQKLHAVKFFDTNPEAYGRGVETLTAVAIGPVRNDWVEGITDYLPLLA